MAIRSVCPPHYAPSIPSRTGGLFVAYQQE